MRSLAEYIISVSAAALLCGILNSMMLKGSAKEVLKLVSGLFLAFCVIRPVSDLRLPEITEIGESIREEASAAVTAGEKLAVNSARDSISEQLEAYILDKAQSLDITLTMQVWPDENGKPHRVSLEGIVPEAGREALSEALETELGIPKEHQIWNES